MKRILAGIVGAVAAIAAVGAASAIDFRGSDDNGQLWTGCNKRTATPTTIIQYCAFALQSGVGNSAGRVHLEIVGDALYRMGVAYRRSGNSELAARHFVLAVQAIDQAITSSPNDPDLRKGRCWFKAVQGEDLNGALADCDEAMKLGPGNAAITEYRGFALFRLGRYQEALEAYNTALTLKTDNPDAQFMRGMVKKKLGDASGGDSDFASAKQGDSHIGEIYTGYGVTN